MENKERKDLELTDDQLELAGGIDKLAAQNVYKVLMNYMSSYDRAGLLPDPDEIMARLRTTYPDLALDEELLMEILKGHYDM